MVKLLRLFRGYIVFVAQGGFVERFMNLCRINEINLWLVENDGVKVKACTTPREFQKICAFAKDAGMDVKALEKRGLPFFSKRHKWRFGAVCGLLLSVIFIGVMSLFIWNVEVIENGVKVKGFTEGLEAQGVHVGALKSHVDILGVQEKLLENFPQLSWVSVNIFGSKAQVEYSLAKKEKTPDDTKTPTNLVASKKGEVVLVEGYKGTNQVKAGDFVVEDSLLISGVIINGDMTEEFVHAKGKVFAKTRNLIERTGYSKQRFRVTDESNSYYKLNFFGLMIPLGFSKTSSLVCKTDINLEGNSTVLPIGVQRLDSIALSDSDVKLVPSYQKLLCLKEIVEDKRRICKNAKIKSVKISEKNDGGVLTMLATIDCVEDIAVEKEVFVEKN